MPTSVKVGMSGNSLERTGPLSASARILPERMLAIELPIGPKLISVRPDIRSLMPCDIWL